MAMTDGTNELIRTSSAELPTFIESAGEHCVEARYQGGTVPGGNDSELK